MTGGLARHTDHASKPKPMASGARLSLLQVHGSRYLRNIGDDCTANTFPHMSSFPTKALVINLAQLLEVTTYN